MNPQHLSNPPQAPASSHSVSCPLPSIPLPNPSLTPTQVEGCDPFFRWLPPSELVDKAAMRTSASTSSMPTEVETLIRSTVQRIRSSGGRVIGLIGFSQGTKLVAGLLRASELRRQHGIAAEDWCDFSFGVSVCGSYPPPLFPQSVKKLLPEGEEPLEKKIAAPTFHALGKADEWMWAGELLIERHFEEGEGKSEVGVFEEMGHHYPSQEDCDRIGEWVVRMVEKAR